MIVTEIVEDFPEVDFRQQHTRSHHKLHLSKVIRDLELSLEPDKFAGTNHWDLNAAAQLGVFWEVVLENAYKEMFAHEIGEVELDGIIGTPDGVNVDQQGLYVDEYKVTWRSSNQTPLDNFYYKCQGMAYCKMVGVNRCRWRILHVMGDYKGSGPQYKQWMVEFTDLELQENWDMIVNHAKHRKWV